MPALVKPLFAGKISSTGNNLTLSGSAIVSAGNSIIVAVCSQSKASTGVTVSDNLGNSYSQVVLGAASGAVALGVRLFRATVTAPGTLTAIYVYDPSGNTLIHGMSAEFSGVGAVRNTGSYAEDNNPYVNVYPSTGPTATAPYLAGDLWIGVGGARSNVTFQNYAAISVAASEPTPEQAQPGMVLGWLYYIAGANSPGNVRMVGQWGSFAQSAGAGVSFQPAPVGIIYNDTAIGAIVFTGTLVEAWKRAFSDAPSGPLALSGTAVDTSGRGFIDKPTGGLAFTASIAESFRRAFIDARTGALPLAGTSVDSWATLKTFSDSPVGTLAVAGTSKATYSRKDAVSGGIAITGTVAEHPGYNDKPVGRIQLWDWAAEHPQYVPRPIGLPGALATSALRGALFTGQVVNPTVLHPSTGSGYAVGDLLVCFVAASVAGFPARGASLVSASSGWTINRPTPIPGSGQGEAHRLYLVTKLAESLAEPPPTLTFDTFPGTGGSPSMARIVAFRGVDTSDMSALADVVGDSDLLTGPTYATGGHAVTTKLPNDLLITLSDILDDKTPYTVQPSTGFTMLTWDAVDSGRGMQAGWAYQVKRTPGLTSNPSFTVSGTQTNESGGIQFALKGFRLVGAFRLSGSVQERYTRTHPAATGVLRLTGSRVERKSYADKPQGALAIAGSTAELYRPPTVDGTLPLTGTVQESWKHGGAVTGKLALSGTVVEERYFAEFVSGRLAITGTAKSSQRHSDVCVAVLKLAGVVSQNLAVSVSPQGAIKLTGRNSEFITIEGAIFYDDFPDGLLKLNGRTVYVNYAPKPGRGGRVVSSLGAGRVVRGSDTGRATGNLTGRLSS